MPRCPGRDGDSPLVRRRRRIGAVIVLAVLAVGVWVLRSFGEDALRRLAVRELRSFAPGEVEIGAVETSIVPVVVVSFRALRMHDRGGRPLASADQVSVRLAAWASLWEGSWIADVTLDLPQVVYRDDDPFWETLTMRRDGSEGARDEGESSFRPRRITVRSGRLEAVLTRSGVRAVVDDLAVSSARSGVVTPAVSFRVSARAMLERSGARVRLRRLAIRGAATGTGVEVESGEIDGDAGEIRFHGSLAGEEVRGGIEWTVFLDPLFALAPEAGVVRGRGRIVADLTGRRSVPEVSGRLEADGVRIDDVEFSGSGSLRARGRDWELGPAEASIFGGEVSGEARGRLVEGVPFEVRGRFRGWDPAVFVRLFGPQTPLRGSWDGTATLKGLLAGDDLSGAGEFTLRDAAAELRGNTSFSVTAEAADVEGALESPSGDRLRCRYRVNRGRLEGEVEGAAARLEAFAPFVGLDLAGGGRVRATFSGTADEPILAGEAEGSAVRVEGVALGDLRGPFEISPQGLRSPGFELFGSRARFQGQLALTTTQTNDWNARVRDASLHDLVDAARRVWPWIPTAEGALDGGLQAAGHWSSLRVASRFAATGTRIAGEDIGRVTGDLTRGDEGWRLDVGVTGEPELRGRIQGGISREGQLSIRFSASGARLERIQALRSRWPELEGRWELDGVLAGTTDRPEGSASVELSNVRLGEQPLTDARGRLHLDGHQAIVEAGAGQVWHVTATIAATSPHAYEAQAEWEDLDLGPFLLPGTSLGIVTRGRGGLRGDLRTPLTEGAAQISRLTIGGERLRLVNRLPIVVRIARGTVEVEETLLESERDRVVFAARIGPDGGEVRSEAKGDLALLEAVVPAVASARGEFQASLTAQKAASGPWRYRGGASVRRGALDVGFLVGITELAGEVSIEDRRATIREMIGKLGGGEFLAEGEVGLEDGWDVGWAVRDADLGIPEWLDYRASGNGRLEGEMARPKLSGEIEITQAVYDRRIEWAEFLPWFRRQTQQGGDALAAPVALDLRLFADGGLFVDNNLAQAELGGDLDVKGTVDSLAWSGRLDVLSGGFIFRRRKFQITAGAVQFVESRPLDPDLEFRGEATVATSDGDYEIQVHVGGTAEAPRIQFTADDPSLTENDVLALVTFGRTVSQLQSQGAGIELTEVLALTAGPKAGRVEERIHDFLPVDRIEIQPTFSRTSGGTEPRLTIGKDLTEGLRALVGTGLGSERQQDVTLEYQLTPRISVQGSWESQTRSEAGAFGGDLKFRYAFRRFSQFSLLRSGREGRP